MNNITYNFFISTKMSTDQVLFSFFLSSKLIVDQTDFDVRVIEVREVFWSRTFNKPFNLRKLDKSLVLEKKNGFRPQQKTDCFPATRFSCSKLMLSINPDELFGLSLCLSLSLSVFLRHFLFKIFFFFFLVFQSLRFFFRSFHQIQIGIDFMFG